MSMPGSFATSSDEDLPYSDGLPGGLSPTASDLATDSDDGDFAPESDIAFNDDDEDLDDDDLDMEDAEDQSAASPAPGELRIAFDGELQSVKWCRRNASLAKPPSFCIAVVTRRVLLLDFEGNAQPLTDQHLQGSTLTLASIRAMLLARSGGGGGRRRVPDEDEDDEEGEEDEDEDPYRGPSRRKPKQWYDVVTEPQEAGVRLERAGEFGPVSHLENDGRKLGTDS